MIVVGFDQAVVGIGHAYGEPGSVPVTGYHRCPDYGDNTCRLGKHVREWASQFMKSIGAEHVFYEQIVVRSKLTFNINTFLKQACVLSNIEAAASICALDDTTWLVPVADWRKSFYAGRRAPRGSDESGAWKSMALTECARRNIYTDNHNVAEAVAIWDYGCKMVSKQYRHQAKVTARRAEMAADEARRAG